MARARRTSAPLLAASAAAVCWWQWRPRHLPQQSRRAPAGTTTWSSSRRWRARGLSFDFYKQSCPRVESVVRDNIQDAVHEDAGIAAGLLRLHFHDCFVQGCDASVLLDGSATGPGEQQAPPNLTLRPSAFAAVRQRHLGPSVNSENYESQRQI